MGVPLHSEKGITRRTHCAGPPVAATTISRRRPAPRSASSTGVRRLSDDVLQAPADAATRKRSRLDSPTASDTPRPSKHERLICQFQNVETENLLPTSAVNYHLSRQPLTVHLLVSLKYLQYCVQLRLCIF